MNSHLIWIAVFFQACSLLIMTQTPWGAVPFIAATGLQGLLLWFERNKQEDAAAIKRQLNALEATISHLQVAVRNI